MTFVNNSGFLKSDMHIIPRVEIMHLKVTGAFASGYDDQQTVHYLIHRLCTVLYILYIVYLLVYPS